MQDRNILLPGVPGDSPGEPCTFCAADGAAPGDYVVAGRWPPERMAYLYLDYRLAGLAASQITATVRRRGDQ